MNENVKSYDLLVSGATDYLKTVLRYHQCTVNRYNRNWRRTKTFLDSKGIKHYDPEVERLVLRYRFGDRHKNELTDHEKEVHNSIKMMTEFAVTGAIRAVPRMNRRSFVFDGAAGQMMLQFIEFKKTHDRLSVTRIRCYQRYLFLFFQYCTKNNIRTIGELDLPFVIRFIRDLDCRPGTPTGTIISTVRNFVSYLYQNKYLGVDYAKKIPRAKDIGQPRLPSTYSKKEIEKLAGSVERSSSGGKRNYAIILMAARLGLRASDIARLRFDSLKWETSTVEVTMVKTGKKLVLPLLPDVGNAIIDYLKYARPESDEPYVFLTERPPYCPFPTSNVVTHVVQRAFRQAGIDTAGRKSGPHALRHSLGFRMLEQNTVLPVISEVFGHQSTESTRYYLRIDLASMRQCMLDVPPVPDSFYHQKGGIFYV